MRLDHNTAKGATCATCGRDRLNHLDMDHPHQTQAELRAEYDAQDALAEARDALARGGTQPVRVSCAECGQHIGYLDTPDPSQQLYSLCDECQAGLGAEAEPEHDPEPSREAVERARAAYRELCLTWGGFKDEGEFYGWYDHSSSFQNQVDTATKVFAVALDAHTAALREELRIEKKRSRCQAGLGAEAEPEGDPEPCQALPLEASLPASERAALARCREGGLEHLLPRALSSAGKRRPAIQFVTSQYEFSHGHKPRGRGSWAFAWEGDEEHLWWTPGSTTYGEAKRLAREAAPEGTTWARVMS